MTDTELDERIAQWRTAVAKSRAVTDTDLDELEGHLRDQVTELKATGLDDDESFLVGVKRLGEVDQLTAEFARVHRDRLWKQLVLPAQDRVTGSRRSVIEVLVFAGIAVVVIQAMRLLAEATAPVDAPQVFGGPAGGWFLRDAGLFILPVLAAYFAWVRRLGVGVAVGLAAFVALLAVVVSVYPFGETSSTGLLVALFLPIVLWFVVGVAYLGGDWRSSDRRMDFVRFTGEWAIYYVLIALGGGVLLGLTAAILTPIGAVDTFLPQLLAWVLPSGIAGAAIVAAWLVESKKSVIENIAPVLTAIFTPLFAVMLLGAAIAYLIRGIGLEFDRDLLTVFDIMLIVVLGLVLYGISARDAAKPPGLLDVLLLITVAAAILLDVLVLASMLARIGEFGFSANRIAALGLNVLLIVNLAGAAWILIRMLARRTMPATLERWQTGYLPLFGLWALLVVVALPPLFSFS